MYPQLCNKTPNKQTEVRRKRDNKHAQTSANY